MNRILLIPTLFTVAACSTSGVEPDRSTAAQATAFVPATESAQAANPAPRQVSSDADAAAEDMVVQNATDRTVEGIEDIEAPNVSQTPPSMIPGRIVEEPEPLIVCERVYPTGSILPVKVCRDRAAAEKKTEYDQEMFDDIKKNTALGNARL